MLPKTGHPLLKMLDHRRLGISKIVRKSRQMLNEIGREPTPEELAEKLGMPLEKVRKVLKILTDQVLGISTSRLFWR